MSERVLCICIIAICGSLISGLPGSKRLQKQLHIVTGLFLLLTIGTSVLNLSFDGVEYALNSIMDDGAAACAEGEALTAEHYRQSITDRVQTYIEDEAARRGISLEAEVLLDREGVPQRAVLYGTGELNAVTAMSSWIQSELGIPKENQLWIGAASKTE